MNDLPSVERSRHLSLFLLLSPRLGGGRSSGLITRRVFSSSLRVMEKEAMTLCVDTSLDELPGVSVSLSRYQREDPSNRKRRKRCTTGSGW